MPLQILLKHGPNATVSAHVGEEGEVIRNDGSGRLHIHNGTDPGGHTLEAVNYITSAPTLISPIEGDDDVAVDTTLQTGPFEGNGTHQSTNWYIATDDAFSNIVHQSENNAVDLLHYPLASRGFSMEPGSVYYVRAQHISNYGAVSEYSTTLSFTTSIGQITGTIEDEFDPDGQEDADAFMGYCVRMSADGQSAIVGAPFSGNTSLGSNDCGRAYLFQKSGGIWSLVETFNESSHGTGESVGSNQQFGIAVEINTDGTLVAISASDSGDGVVYIFKYVTSAWTFHQKLTNPQPTNVSRFGVGLAMTNNANRIVVGGVGSTSGDTIVAIYSVYLGNYSLEQTLTDPVNDINSRYGIALDINQAGDVLVITNRSADTTVNNSGTAYLATRSGTTWTQGTGFKAPTPINSQIFGNSCSLNAAGDLLAVGAPYFGTSGDGGQVYLFSVSGTTATLISNITIPGVAQQDYVGYSVALNGPGNRLVVGCVGDDTRASGGGAVAVAYLEEDTWTFDVEVNGSQGSEIGTQFGWSVDTSYAGDSFIVGEVKAIVSGTKTGKAYIYN